MTTAPVSTDASWQPRLAPAAAPAALSDQALLRPRRSAASTAPALAAGAPRIPTSPAEPVDRPVGRNSAFAVSRPAPAPEVAVDALFAGLATDAPETESSGDAPRRERASEALRASRAERKAAKSVEGTTDTPRNSFPAEPVREAEAVVDDFAALIAASAGAAPVAPAVAQAGAVAPPAVRVAADSTPAAPAAEAPTERPRRAASTVPRRNPARTPAAATAPSGPVGPAAKSRVTRSSRIARVSSGFAAMGFAALLAVATSVPALSLLSPADVQAMALTGDALGSEPGQQVEITGGTLAQTVEREAYATQTIDEYARAAGIRAEATFTNNPAGTVQWPFAVGVHIGDQFGYRDCAGCSSDHGGQDFNPGLGAEIQSIADGTVANSTDSGGSLGVVMMIDHVIDGERITSVYAHMEYGSRRFETGDTVRVGDVIGQTGDTGMSTGPHLHFEIRLGGMGGTKVDPLVWLYENTN
ncbi:M23 family metallopeptidase [Agromyces badenianii]|uniref:M23 family metallopeptidase n=1 Tax=Agromyces badenianii TaxID=2080742 RepID=UPI0011B1F383|nr:M23 family metallopeptidase [Agromyces badenianii]